MLHKSASMSQRTGSGPSFMTNDQLGDYLQHLRTNPTSRPQGSRPPPPSLSRTPAPAPRISNSLSRPRGSLPSAKTEPVHGSTSRSASLQSKSSSQVSNQSGATTSSRRQPSLSLYVDREQRQVEKREARELRLALEGADKAEEEERRMHEAASEEAAELIWKHQNPGAPYRLASSTPDSPSLQDSPINTENAQQTPPAHDGETEGQNKEMIEHNRYGSLHSSIRRSVGPKPLPIFAASTPLNHLPDRRRSSGNRRVSGGANVRLSFPNEQEKIYEDPSCGGSDIPEEIPQDPVADVPKASVEPNAEEYVPAHVRRNPFARARESRSGRASFRLLPASSRAPVLPVEDPAESAVAAQTTPIKNINNAKLFNISLGPEQSSNFVEEPSEEVDAGNWEEMEMESDVRYRDGVEIRSDELRAATSMRLKDRSSKLPSPTVVSDNPGRPIVSFKPDWTPSANEEQLNINSGYVGHHSGRPLPSPLVRTGNRQSPDPVKSASAPIVPLITVDEGGAKDDSSRDSLRWGRKAAAYEPPAIPTIITDDATKFEPARAPKETARTVPIINYSEPADSSIPSINADKVPKINVEDHRTPPERRQTQPAPAVSRQARSSQMPQTVPSRAGDHARPPPRHAATAPARSQFHMTPSIRRQTALCAQCALPISGKIVSAAGARFHPDCFTCFHCGEALECVAFYPEPAQRRNERVERIERRKIQGRIDEDMDDESLEAADGDDSLRFYCHLDYHEFFSPRCKSCKTPIEGEVILACGAEWHVGHFFCAQCGDPFDPSTPFVEKDGYAWCVNCHTNRTSARCKKCKKPVTDMVVKALDAEWHEECFRCTDCNGAFEDGRYFVKGKSQEPVCYACGEMRLKA